MKKIYTLRIQMMGEYAPKDYQADQDLRWLDQEDFSTNPFIRIGDDVFLNVTQIVTIQVIRNAE